MIFRLVITDVVAVIIAAIQPDGKGPSFFMQSSAVKQGAVHVRRGAVCGVATGSLIDGFLLLGQ